MPFGQHYFPRTESKMVSVEQKKTIVVKRAHFETTLIAFWNTIGPHFKRVWYNTPFSNKIICLNPALYILLFWLSWYNEIPDIKRQCSWSQACLTRFHALYTYFVPTSELSPDGTQAVRNRRRHKCAQLTPPPFIVLFDITSRVLCLPPPPPRHKNTFLARHLGSRVLGVRQHRLKFSWSKRIIKHLDKV